MKSSSFHKLLSGNNSRASSGFSFHQDQFNSKDKSLLVKIKSEIINAVSASHGFKDNNRQTNLEFVTKFVDSKMFKDYVHQQHLRFK
jgi:hypothetical protein